MPRLGELRQAAPGRTQTRVRVVPELGHQRVVLEHGLDDPALDPSAAAVDQSKFAKTGFVCGPEVLLDHGGDIARGERVEIELRLDRNSMGHQASRTPRQQSS